MRVLAVFLLMAWLLPVSGAFATARLNTTVIVDGNDVTIGDLFSNAGTLANEPVMQSPAPGERMVFWSDQIADLVSDHGLEWTVSKTEKIVVERSSQVILGHEIAARIADELFILTGGDELEIQLANRGAELHVALDEPAEFDVRRLNFNSESGRFSAVLVPPSGDLTGQRLKVAGRAFEIIEVPVLRQKIQAKAVIGEADVYWVNVRASDVNNDTVTELDELIGMAARRPIRADEPVRLRDLEPPILIVKGSPVTMVYRTDAMILTMIGKAIDNGATGATVRVLNTQSNAVIQAVVAGPDLVTVPAAMTIGFN